MARSTPHARPRQSSHNPGRAHPMSSAGSPNSSCMYSFVANGSSLRSDTRAADGADGEVGSCPQDRGRGLAWQRLRLARRRAAPLVLVSSLDDGVDVRLLPQSDLRDLLEVVRARDVPVLVGEERRIPVGLVNRHTVRDRVRARALAEAAREAGELLPRRRRLRSGKTP